MDETLAWLKTTQAAMRDGQKRCLCLALPSPCLQVRDQATDQVMSGDATSAAQCPPPEPATSRTPARRQPATCLSTAWLAHPCSARRLSADERATHACMGCPSRASTSQHSHAAACSNCLRPAQARGLERSTTTKHYYTAACIQGHGVLHNVRQRRAGSYM